MKMTMLVRRLKALAKQFDSVGYPAEVYFHILRVVQSASTPDELAQALAQALAWKDGKVRLDTTGPHIISTNGSRYRIAATKPNTLAERHRDIMSSQTFYDWASKVRLVENFDPGLIDRLKGFGLWSSTGSIVIPVFILHVLAPRIYPIIDRWVLIAFRFLSVGGSDAPHTISVNGYAAYQAFWVELLAEAGLSPMSAQLDQLKELDAGLWAFGKSASTLLPSDEGLNNSAEGDPAEATSTETFKRLAVTKWKAGQTQSQAIQDAARELGIELKPSHIRYPASHFDRWKRQGIF